MRNKKNTQPRPAHTFLERIASENVEVVGEKCGY
jgi:hypothetical protein